MSSPTDDPKTWFDPGTRDGQEKVGAAYANKGWNAPTWRPGQSYDAHQNELTGYNNTKKS